MTVPSNAVQSNGIGAVSDDQLNTAVQGDQTATQLRGFVGIAGMSVMLQGIAAPGDGGAGLFYWNAGSVYVDDNLNVIVPSAAAGQGAWLRAPFRNTSASSLIVTDGTLDLLNVGTIVTGANLTLTSGGTGQATIEATGTIGFDLTVSQGTSSVSNVSSIDVIGGSLTSGGTGQATIDVSNTPSLVLSDGTTTVNNVGTIDVVGGTVSSGGTNDVTITVSGSSGGSFIELELAIPSEKISDMFAASVPPATTFFVPGIEQGGTVNYQSPITTLLTGAPGINGSKSGDSISVTAGNDSPAGADGAGVINLTTGSGKSGNVVGGDMNVTTGDGFGSGKGGGFEFLGGDGGTTGDGGRFSVFTGGGKNGGPILFTANDGNNGKGGRIGFAAGLGGGTKGAGGEIRFTAGNGAGSGNGGELFFQSGFGDLSSGTGAGGPLTFITGDGGATSGASGDISFNTGAAAVGNTGTITFGTANAPVGKGGDIEFSPGTGSVRNGQFLFHNAPTVDPVVTDAIWNAGKGTGLIKSGDLPILTGTSGSIGGGALLSGGTVTGTVAIANCTTNMAVIATPVADPGAGVDWSAYVSSAGTVTVVVTAIIAVTPTARAYNVRVLP